MESNLSKQRVILMRRVFKEGRLYIIVYGYIAQPFTFDSNVLRRVIRGIASVVCFEKDPDRFSFINVRYLYRIPCGCGLFLDASSYKRAIPYE